MFTSGRKRPRRRHRGRAGGGTMIMSAAQYKANRGVVMLGVLLLAVLMLTPIVLLEMPDQGKGPNHVGLLSLMHKSKEIRKNWRSVMEHEKSLLQQRLPRFFHQKKGEEEEEELPVRNTATTIHPYNKNNNKQQQQQQQQQQQREEEKKLARGVAGLPMEKTPALIGAKVGHVECDEDVNEMVYWNDPQGQRDVEFQTPFGYNDDNQETFLSFEADIGGWNNVRMSLENILVLASAMNRTLIMPPKSPLYLLLGNTIGAKASRTFAGFYNLQHPALKNHVRIMSMPDFLQTHGTDLLGLTNSMLDDLKPIADMCLHQPNIHGCGRLFQHFQKHGYQPPFEEKECFVFDVDTYHGDDKRKELEQRVQRFCGSERKSVFYTKDIAHHRLIHWQTGGMRYRLLTQFYAFAYFTDPVIDNFYKRFVRDFLRYRDEIYCAAGKVVHALQQSLPEDSPSSFAAFHVRRGEFQYKETRLSAEEWYNNTKELLKENETIFIATDEHNKSFFDPIARHGHPLRFLDDYNDQIKGLDSSYLGMIDAIVASRGRIFVGTWFSTFSAYINRLRGYSGMPMKDSFYSWLPRKYRMHKWQYIVGNYPAREFPIAWSGIDGDEWIEHETTMGQETHRVVPTVTLEELEQDTGYSRLPMARGLAGRPMGQTPALVGGSRAHVKCDINVDSLAYWNDPQGDFDTRFASPFSSGETKYVSFAPDRGGWNNVRMSLEVIFVYALVTKRTVVLPPSIKLYLLQDGSGDKHRGFADFFPIHTDRFQKRLPVITMEEFLTKNVVPLPQNKTRRQAILDASANCDLKQKSTKSCFVLYEFLEQVGYIPRYRAEETCVVFDEGAYAGNDVPESTMESINHICGERNISFVRKDEVENEPLIHFRANDKEYRLLTHFYNMLHFTDPVVDHFTKRFVRDFMHYHDSIYCAAGKIVKALQVEGQQKQRKQPPVEDGAGGFSAMHIRRGDFQYKKVKLAASLWYNNTKELWMPNEILYIATDERNKSWFDPIGRHYELRFLDDYWELAGLADLDPNYMGMIDTIVASRARVFAGTWFSTFSGYINRMRGYHGMSMQDSWYSFLPRKTAVHQWNDVNKTAYAYEWPTGWIGIDANEWPQKDKF